MRQLLCVISLIRVLVSASHKQVKEFRGGATDTKEHLLQMLVEENMQPRQMLPYLAALSYFGGVQAKQ